VYLPSAPRQSLTSRILGWVKHWFPEFEFTWLGEEMRENLPKEMDFAHEARNAKRAVENFKGVHTSLYIPEVLFSSDRVLVMEYIQGGRVDDLEFLDAHDIDRNKVAVELSSIFSRMVHLDGWFHADPHPGRSDIRRFGPLNDPFVRQLADPSSASFIAIPL
jgi:aarF domain-containing kinase